MPAKLTFYPYFCVLLFLYVSIFLSQVESHIKNGSLRLILQPSLISKGAKKVRCISSYNIKKGVSWKEEGWQAQGMT